MLTLQGIRRLSQFDPIGFLFFDASRKGFWRSFYAALVCLPVWVLEEYQQTASLEHDAAIRFLIIQAIAFAVAWLVYPLVVLQIADWFGVWPNYYRYMVAYNWFQPVLQLMWVPLLLLEFLPGAHDAETLSIFYILLWCIQAAYGWFIARNGLCVSISTAAALPVIDIGLSYLIVNVATRL